MEIEFDAFNGEVAAAIDASLGRSSAGHPADRPDLHGDLPGLPAALGRMFATIHGLAVPSHVEPARLDRLVAERFERGTIRPGEFPDPYSRHDAAQLVQIWRDGAERCADRTVPVCLVGAATIDRLLMDGGEVAAVRGEFGLVGDRHLDLAVIQNSIHNTLGPEAVFGFYEAYGSDPNIVLLDHFVLTGLLLGWIR